MPPPSWSWAAGESSLPGATWKRLAESLVWALGGFALQLAAARLTMASWAAPDFLVLAVVGLHYLWGLPGGLLAAAALGLATDGLAAMPLGLTVSGLVAAALVAEWFRGGAVGGFGGMWMGPTLGAAAAAAVWRVVVWGWGRGAWPDPLDVVVGIGLTMLTAGLIAALRRRLVHPRSRRPRVVAAR